MANISDRIREALSIRGMKQSELVERTGIGKSSISTYISGTYEPKQKNIYNIAKALNVSEAWLIGFDVPMDRTIVSRPAAEHFEMTDLEKQIIIEYRQADELSKAMALRSLSIDEKLATKGDAEKME